MKHVAPMTCLLLLAALALAGCGSSTPPQTPAPPVVVNPDPDPDPDPEPPLPTRYAFANRCVVLKSEDNGQYLAAAGATYTASAAQAADAEPFFFKPAALGQYLLYNRAGQLLRAATPAGNLALSAASDQAIFSLRADGDTTDYPPAPAYDREPTPAQIAAYRDFRDPQRRARVFTLASIVDGQRLSVRDDGTLVVAAAAETDAQRFELEAASGCAPFPEASSNTEGESFKGTLSDGRVLGMADTHVHISATTFLGGAQYGSPFHRFGVTHALGDCSVEHGETGHKDAVGGLFTMDPDGHATDGWPTFTDWPARRSLTHEAIYWKWQERAWKAGLRLIVNDVVDNETLCELQRNVAGTPTRDCNEMNNAANQVGTLYAMQDYIDAQYGGPGQGFFRIVLDPAEARAVIADGKMAVVIGVEISNLFNCQLTYNPLRTQEPFEETGTGERENRYGCASTETGADHEILTQLNRLWNLGVRQVITIHEFDNAFGGNGIFDDLVLNLGNRENTGGIPSGDLAALAGAFGEPSQTSPLGNFATTETPTGEFWTTYDCPVVTEGGDFSGYVFGSTGGDVMASPPGCVYTGQGGRPGGSTACYPAKPQCNARWLTPTGLYTYRKLMEAGMIFDIDHLELEIKTQALELAEAQDPPYPFVSTHGDFGGTSVDQAQRIYRNGGHIYPSLDNGPSHIGKMQRLREIWTQAGSPGGLFGFGFGTDTNGLSAQSSPRGNIAPGKEVVYPYALFDGPLFDEMPEFSGIGPVLFRQPEERDAAGNGRTWSLDQDGSAHYGMMSGLVQEMRLEGTPENMRDLFNAAEVYLRTWERTLASSAAIREKGFVVPDGVLRPAPKPTSPLRTP
ncbi:MAG: hypothetical protein ACLGHI_00030 [Gammaproteobacteria bacterium]